VLPISRVPLSVEPGQSGAQHPPVEYRDLVPFLRIAPARQEA